MSAAAENRQRDLLDDAVYQDGARVIPAAWLALADAAWSAEEVADLWERYAEAVRVRDGLLDLPRAEFVDWRDRWLAEDLAEPRQESAIEVMAQEADDVFVLLRRGPVRAGRAVAA